MISEIIYHHYKYIQKVMLFIVILSTDILECEEFNPPVDSFDELTEASTILTIEETNAESTIGSTIYELPTQPTIDESTIEGPTPHSVEQADQTLTFQIMEGASERGKRKLIDSCGFSYNVKRQRLHSTDWQCTVRPTVRSFFFCHYSNVTEESVSFLTVAAIFAFSSICSFHWTQALWRKVGSYLTLLLVRSIR